MILTNRQKDILNYLLLSPSGIRISDLEVNLKVSRRTIYRELADLKQAISSQNLKILNIRGKYSLSGAKKDLELLRRLLIKERRSDNLSIVQREKAIAAILLFNSEPCKILQLAQDLNVSEATIQNELDVVETSLKQYHITLVRKKGVGVYVEGKEIIKRQVLLEILINEINEYDFFKYLQNNQAKIDNVYLQLFNQDELRRVNKCLKVTIFDKIALNSDQIRIELILSFAIAIRRIISGNHIISFNSNNANGLLKYEALVYQFVSLFCEQEIIDFSQVDVAYLANRLLHSDYQKQFPAYENANEVKILMKVASLVKAVSEEYKFDFSKNPSFIQEIGRHILNLLNHRVKFLPNAKIESLNNLSKHFKTLYQIIQLKWQDLFKEVSLPSSEFQLLLLYFAKEYTSRKNINYFSALVICENGIGTSAILRTRLKQEFPSFEKIRIYQVSELANVNLQDFDVILSTLKLAGFPRDYLLVSPLLLDDEINKIRSYLKNYTRKYPLRSKKTIVPVKEKVNYSLQLSNLALSSLFCSEIVNGIRVQRVKNENSDLNQIINTCLGQVDNSLLHDKDEVAKRIEKRVALAPIGIPNSQLAFLHTTSRQVTRCFFGVFDLEREIKLKAMDQQEIEVKRLLLLLAPSNLSSLEHKLMSMLSSMVIINNENLNLFDQGKQAELKNAIAKELFNYIKTEY